ncbi:hypothetical protein BpHYR1_012378 [Brachionus plicatilis]|uniref:Uncharacterized protein n=1 Tax=Brachionus plicatilis TaxID=10195 RepID=A0A3M7RUR7_BRAPC|nr:hypothetical protein BpHYR1_012378 [Brachionus plicatilis]
MQLDGQPHTFDSKLCLISITNIDRRYRYFQNRHRLKVSIFYRYFPRVSIYYRYHASESIYYRYHPMVLIFANRNLFSILLYFFLFVNYDDFKDCSLEDNEQLLSISSTNSKLENISIHLANELIDQGLINPNDHGLISDLFIRTIKDFFPMGFLLYKNHENLDLKMPQMINRRIFHLE